jgi:hypothetical protein
MQDLLGKEIKPGQVVVYPVRRRSTISLCHATVISTEGELICMKTDKDQARQVKLKYPNRCAVVK